MTARQYMTAAEFRARPFGVPLRQFEDDQINEFLQVATEAVENHCERVFSSLDWTETFMGDGTDSFLVQQYPITAIKSITKDGVALDEDSVFVRTTLNDNMGRLQLDGDTFSASSTYVVTYTAGFSPVPATVKHATGLWATELMRPDYGGASGEVPEIVPLTTEQIVELLQPLRRRRI